MNITIKVVAQSQTVSVEELGYTELDWNAMSEEDQYQIVRDYWKDEGAPDVEWEED